MTAVSRRAGAVSGLAILLAVLWPQATWAWPQCAARTAPIHTGVREIARTQAGRVVTVTLRSAAMQGDQQVEVLLPSGFDDSGRTRYPVLYLLHGAGGTGRKWLENAVEAQMLEAFAGIVVMPDGSGPDAAGTYTNGGYSDWFGIEAGTPGPAFAWETYHVHELVPFVDAHWPTRADAGGRAIAGISMGGGGAFKYAAEYPGTFGYAASLSGELDPWLPAARAFQPETCRLGDPDLEEVVWRDNDATSLAGNLRGVRLFVRCGDGTPGPFDSPTEPSQPGPAIVWRLRLLVEFGAHLMAEDFLDAARAAGLTDVDAQFYQGSHSSPYWEREMASLLAWLRGQLERPPRLPRSITVASAHERFTAWGWRFRARRAVREFVYLKLGRRRLVAIGSGRLDVVTPARWKPGATYAVRVGGTVQRVTADRHGRLAVTVRLGPSHTAQQVDFGPDATRGWRTVRVRIDPHPLPLGPAA